MNVVATRAAEGFPRRSFTVAEIRRMVEAGIIAEDENFELIDGELVPMSPKGNQHEVIKAALNAVFVTALASKGLRVAIETSLYLEERTFVEPDLCIYPKRITRHGVPELWVIDAATRATWVLRRPQADGQWGSVEKIPTDAPLSPEALESIAVRMADLD